MKRIFEILVFLLLLSLAMLAMSCGGTRQTNTEKQSNIEIKNEYQEGSKIVFGNTFTYMPFDALKPMKIEGKIYENAIVSNDKSKTFETYKHFNIYHHFNIKSKKETIREDNTWLWLGLFLIIVFGVLAWFKIPSFKTGV